MPFTDDQVMLCLAGLTYRGFNDAAVGAFHTDVVRRAIMHGLDRLPPVAGEWEMVWGPAIYRAATSLLDDELMYVVRGRKRPSRYVVAIRGTNPVSAFDWLFGDLWAGRKTAWRYGDGSARVSISTALGLNLLQGLRSDGPRQDDALWRLVDSRTSAVPVLEKGLLGTLAGLAGHAIAPLRVAFGEVLETLARRRSAQPAPDADQHVQAAVELWKSRVRTLALELIDRVGALVGDRFDVALLALLEDEARLRASLGVGSDLVTFLAGAVEHSADPVEIVVTGHSKGGALASTLALWLAETQGPTASTAERWDPQRRATVHCWSFAAPTAGDESFVARSNAIIGPRCHRIANQLDVVPHAWALAELARIPELYDPTVVPALPAIETLVVTITAVTQKLGYTHVGNLVTELPGKVDRTKPFFFHQLVHQHMQAYLDLMGLTEAGVDTVTLFDPLAALPQ